MNITKIKADIVKTINNIENKDKLKLIKKLLAHLSYEEEVDENEDEDEDDEDESWALSPLKDMLNELRDVL